jgi:hypothetical protein
MANLPWCARVISNSGRGAGILLTDSTVLSCQHVVGGERDKVKVWFPANDRTVDATVKFASERGDVAVLRLDERVDLDPAPFAPFSAIDVQTNDQLPKLAAVGYPRGFNETGISTSLQVMESVGSPGGQVQVRRLTDSDTPLEEGFSGAAAFMPTGRIVGMVTRAAKTAGYGLVLPLGSIAYHWPEFEDRVPLGDAFDARAYSKLRGILDTVRLQDRPVIFLNELLRRRIGVLGGNQVRPPTLMSVVEYVATELSRPMDEIRSMVFELLSLIQDRAPGVYDDLQYWMRDHVVPLPVAAPEPKKPEADGGSVIVRIARSGTGDAYEVSLTRVDCKGKELEFKFHGRHPRSDIQDAVEQALDEMFASIPAQQYQSYFVEFAMPPNLQTEPVERWTARYDDQVPLGWSNPVMIRDLRRFDEGSPTIEEHWVALRDSDAIPIQWRACWEPAGVLPFQAWLRKRHPRVVGLAGLPAGPLLNKASEFDVPVVVWTRETCTNHGASDATTVCHGSDFQEAVSGLLAGQILDAIPMLVHEMRLTAGESGNPTACGNSVALFWDDPKRRPVSTGMGMPDEEAR